MQASDGKLEAADSLAGSPKSQLWVSGENCSTWNNFPDPAKMFHVEHFGPGLELRTPVQMFHVEQL